MIKDIAFIIFGNINVKNKRLIIFDCYNLLNQLSPYERF